MSGFISVLPHRCEVLGFRHKVQRSDVKSKGHRLNPKGVARHGGFWDSTGMVRDWRGLPGMGQGLTRECGALSKRGPTAPKGSEGPRRMYVQGFVEWVQVLGADE